MNTHQFENLIQNYLRGRMSAAEREQFEQQLETESGLAEELALQRAEMAASERLLESETREWFREWQQPAQSFHRRNLTLWLAAFAAGAFVLVAAVYLLNRPGSPPPNRALQPPLPVDTPAVKQSPEPSTAPPPAPAEKPVAAKPTGANYFALATRNFQEPVLPGTRQLTADSAAGIIRRAQAAYTAGDYRGTLALLAQADSARAQSATFLEAHALFHLKQFAEAEARFESLVAANSRQFRYPAEWGLLMCRLANFPNREQEFRHQLDAMLANPQHPYFEQAKNLESALNE